jgi:hypothetical protein
MRTRITKTTLDLLIAASAGFITGFKVAKIQNASPQDAPEQEPKPLPDPYKLDPFSRTMRIMGEIVAVGSLAVVLMLWGFVIAMQFVYAFNVLFK